MVSEFERFTLLNTVEFQGFGLHSGNAVKVKIEPSDQGIIFHCGGQQVSAHPDHVTDTSRCTRLGHISTVEHLMSAFAAFGITDASVELSADELPALDGSAVVFLDGLVDSGKRLLGKCGFSLFERVFLQEDQVRIGISKGSGHWKFDFETGNRWPQFQSFEIELNSERYKKEIASARTFAFEEEVEPIRQAGLAKGLDANSALILGSNGYVNDPRFDDEPVRHKMLDLIGDLYLSGVPMTMINVVSSRSGHKTNVEAAKKLAAHAKFIKV